MGRPCRGRAAPEGVAGFATTPGAGGRALPVASGSGASPVPERERRGFGALRVWTLPAELPGRAAAGLAGSLLSPGGRRRLRAGWVRVCVSSSLCRPPPCRSSPSLLTNSLPCFFPRPPGFCFVDVGGFLL